MSKSTQILGELGEKIVFDFLVSKGYNPHYSESKIDREKDIYLEEDCKIIKIEVKTQPPFRTKNMLSIRDHQLVKCLNCDWLFFVTTPTDDEPNYKYASCIFVCEHPKTLLYHHYDKIFFGKVTKMIGFKIKQPAIKLVAKIEDKEMLQALRENRAYNGSNIY